MTIFDDIAAKTKAEIPGYQIGFKDQNWFMKLLSTILFFNKSFKTDYVTTIGNTSYFPNAAYITSDPIAAAAVLLHELVHVYDYKNSNGFLYGLAYLFPQFLFLLSIPFLFIFGWKLALIPLLFLAPIPSYFRMIDEKRAYTVQIYVSQKLAQKYGYTVNLDNLGTFCAQQFTTGMYYFMWPFSSVNQYFSETVATVKAGGRPAFVENAVYDLMDKIIDS